MLSVMNIELPDTIEEASEIYLSKTDIIDFYIFAGLPDFDDPVFQFIREEVYRRVRRNFTNEAQSVILREFRHATDGDAVANEYWVKDTLGLVDEHNLSKFLFSSFKGEKGKTLINNRAAYRHSGIHVDFEKIAYIFRKDNGGYWVEGYGGESWADVTEAYIEVEEAKDYHSFVKAFDHFVDLAHNSGPVVTSFRDGRGEFLVPYLDLKYLNLNPKDLFVFCSPNVRTILSIPEVSTYFRSFSVPDRESKRAALLRRLFLKWGENIHGHRTTIGGILEIYRKLRPLTHVNPFSLPLGDPDEQRHFHGDSGFWYRIPRDYFMENGNFDSQSIFQIIFSDMLRGDSVVKNHFSQYAHQACLL